MNAIQRLQQLGLTPKFNAKFEDHLIMTFRMLVQARARINPTASLLVDTSDQKASDAQIWLLYAYQAVDVAAMQGVSDHVLKTIRPALLYYTSDGVEVLNLARLIATLVTSFKQDQSNDHPSVQAKHAAADAALEWTTLDTPICIIQWARSLDSYRLSPECME